jgi:hypothetical protein
MTTVHLTARLSTRKKMTSSQQNTDETFEFTLMRRQLVDAAGSPVDGDGQDPEQWTLADALSDAGAPLDVLPVGRGRMTVLSLDEREFVREKLMHHPEPHTQFLRAMLEMDESAEREPGMEDLLAVLLPGDVTVLYEVVITWADLELAPESTVGGGAEALVSLPRGHAILRRGQDLPVVCAGCDSDYELHPDIGHGGSNAQH